MPLRVEFHCHTRYSKDSLCQIPQLIQTAKDKGLDRVVITDHNTIQGALEAKKYDPSLIIVGEEILTQKGELLAAFVKEEVPAGLSPLETIRLLKQQGAFISVSHPFDIQRHGWKLSDLVEIVPFVDAIEVFNSRCLWNSTNQKAQAFAQKYQLAQTVGSDAHTYAEIGTSVLELEPFCNAEELRLRIRQGQAITHLSSPWVHGYSLYAKLSKQINGKFS